MPGYFLLTLENAEKYFERCLQKEAVTEAERLQILKDLEAEGNILARGSTPDTKEDFAKKLSEYANVLVVENKRRKGKRS
jgi:hypothetical protein